jgi:Alpha-amylase C-terminal beta-sheet domain/Alpha amylase, catalytic domain/Starch-binding module 26/Chitobiase/beta-hexosaminidase C-terminal domain/Secretion system C-terminal sorting domain
MNFKFIPFILLFAFAQNAAAQNSDVMMQGFNWNSSTNTTGWYNVVNAKVAEMKAGGINTIWLPPPSKSAAKEGYLPSEYYMVSTPYGTQAQLQSLIANLHTNNMKALADIVINHRVGTTNWADFTNPTWGCWAVCNNDEWTGRCGNADSGDGYAPARDIDHSNAQVRTDIIAWMNWLKGTIGFDGWRYDYVRGFSGDYVKQYNDATQPYFSVGEQWNTDRQVVQNWIDATQQRSTAFDFPTKGILQDALNANNYSWLSNGGQAPGLIGWSPAKAVTFIDNHDTGSSQNHWPFPGGKVMQGYAYILTHPGIPMVFWDHYFDWGLQTPINALIKVRKDNGLTATSALSIQTAQANVYAAIIDGKVAMKIGPGNWSPSGTGWVLKASGTDYAVWDKSTTVVANTPPVVTVTPAGPYTSTTAFNVTLSVTDNGTATIYYTLDGTQPTTLSTVAANNTVINIATSKTLKVYALDNQNAVSATQTHVYTVNALPVLTVTPAGPYSSSATFNAVLSAPNATIYYTLDGTTPTTASTNAANTLTLSIAASKTVKAFAKNAGGQTAVQTHAYTIVPNTAPVVTVTPAGPYSGTSAVTVSVSATDNSGIAPTIYYTLDGTTPTTASPSSTTALTLNIATSKTLKVFARDNQSLNSAVQTHIYTITPPAGFTVYFKKPTAWATPYIHYWNALPAGNLANCTWPCEPMQAHSVADWYKKTFTGITSTNLLFHNNAGTQTADQTRSAEGSFDNGVWTNGAPTGSPATTTFVMDGVLDASATPLVTNTGVTIYTAFSGGKMYVATQAGATYANKDVFIYVSANPSGVTAVPWSKAAQVAGNCKILVSEGSNTFAGWSGATATAVASANGTILEGQITLSSEFAGATQLYIAVGVYGTNNSGLMEKQCPAAITANSNLEANEFQLISIPPMRLAADPNAPAEANTDIDGVERLANPQGGTTVQGVTLYQNTPNPFSTETAISFDVTTPQNVVLSIFDTNGRLVETLQKGEIGAGRHQFVYDAATLPKGVYTYILEVNGERIVKKMMVF